MTASPSLEIYLGSISPPANKSGVVQAATLREAKPDNSPLARLKIVVRQTDLASSWSPMDLAAFSLQPNAVVAVHILESTSNNTSLQPIHTAFLLAGLVATGERRESDQERVLTATRKVPSVTVAALKNVVQITNLDDDEELVDEDNLLADSSNLLAPPPAMSQAASKGDDCGGRKPCDDCTCGRADAEKQQERPVIKTSSCGKCGLGDAFRCASCPYLGKPAFKPGEEHLVLDLQDDL